MHYHIVVCFAIGNNMGKQYVPEVREEIFETKGITSIVRERKTLTTMSNPLRTYAFLVCAKYL